jgi:O-antigen/teichoic acid export membrane protein
MFEKIKRLLLKNTSARQTIAKNTFWLTVSNIGGRLLRAIVIIYAARLLGPHPYGVFTYAISLVAFLSVFVDLGLNSILTREVAKDDRPETRARLISTIFYLKALLLALGIASIMLFAPRLTTIQEAIALFPLISIILILYGVHDFAYPRARNYGA